MILILADRLEPSSPQIPGSGLVQLRLPGQVRAVSGLGQEKRAGFGCQERIP